MTAPIWSWADSPLSSDWPWVRNVTISATLAKGDDYPKSGLAPHELTQVNQRAKGDKSAVTLSDAQKDFLSDLESSETLEVVGHGAVKGGVGGHSAEQVTDLLTDMGLGKDSSGAKVNLQACLAASSATDLETGQSTTQKVQSGLAKEGVDVSVKGYEGLIFGKKQYEVPSEFTDEYINFEHQQDAAKAAKEASQGAMEDPGGKLKKKLIAEAAKLQKIDAEWKPKQAAALRPARLVSGKNDKMEQALHRMDANPLRDTVAPKPAAKKPFYKFW